MQFDPVLITPRMAAMQAAGWWREHTIHQAMADALARCPDKDAVVAYCHDGGSPVRLSYRALEDRVARIAGNLVRLGVGRQDVVSFQLPNGWEFIALSLACARIGAVANPVMPIFRQHELNFMLNFGEAKVFIVPQRYRGFDYPAMARGMRAGLPHLRQLVVVGEDGDEGFDACLLRPVEPAPADWALRADEVLLLMYTSGTTGEPKGVMHTSNTLFANLRAYIERMELAAQDVVLGASPMAHLTGYGYLAMLPILLGATTVLQDIWDPRRALDIARRENVSFSMASTPFVADLCAAVEAGEALPERFKLFCCAGAPIPPALIERAQRVLGMRLCSAWGMTENGAVTVTPPTRAHDKSGVSDGLPLPGMQLKVVDVLGQPLPPGENGALWVRGASLFAGYLKRPQLNGVDADGWFDTGDVACLDADGYVRITGRTKDVVIRGGENIPVVEIENLLYQHPAIASLAIVGYPDARLGERVCAFVTLNAGATFSFAEMVAYLESRQVARQYFPERLEINEELPRTPSGKLQKFKLRDAAKSFADAANREGQA